MGIIHSNLSYDYSGRKRKKNKSRTGTKKYKAVFKPYKVKETYADTRIEEAKQYKSFEGTGNSTARTERQVYSGDYVVGLATMHKSNIVPVGRGDSCESYAKMRRN